MMEDSYGNDVNYDYGIRLVIFSQLAVIVITIKVVLAVVRVALIHGDTTHVNRYDDQVIQMANR
jgi:hypothetical protein